MKPPLLSRRGLFPPLALSFWSHASQSRSAPLREPEKGRRSASRLQPFVDDGTLAGAVTLVAEKDKVLSLEAVGWADVAAKKPMKTNALFWIASQSKPITARRLHDPGGRGQGETWTIRSKNICRSSRT